MEYIIIYIAFLLITWAFIMKSIHDAPEMEDTESHPL